MSKKMIIMLIAVVLFFGSIFLYKLITGLIIKHKMQEKTHIVSVSAMTVAYSKWQPKLTSTVTLRAIDGVNVTTELAGMVQTIYFTPGKDVKKNELMVQLNADNDIALLNSLKANAELAKITYQRDKSQYAIHAVSKQILDNDFGTMKSLEAQVTQQAAIVEKKSIKAPFDGRLGIMLIDPGQFLNPGDGVASLQRLDPLYADFFLPQQALGQIKVGQEVIITTDAFPKNIYKGKITTINPEVDVASRNVEVEATIANPNKQLLPGMFGDVDIIIDKPASFLTVPQTAITYNSFGEIVYIIKAQGEDKNHQPVLTVKQHFVKTGDTRGEQIQILKGLKEGDRIVTSGQLKLKNNSQIAINNTIQPSNSPNPQLNNNH